MKFYLRTTCLVLFSLNASATELVHHFSNPDFIGGDANKGADLLNSAINQNSYKAPVVSVKPHATTSKTALQLYADKIQTALLNNISTAQTKAIKDQIIDPTTGYIVPNIEVPLGGGYTITTSSPINNTMSMRISDGISNTTFTVPYLNQ